MLGSTLAVIPAQRQASNVQCRIPTAFGAQLENSSTPELSNFSSFFTGKPLVEGLGNVFLFRNYRSDLGKWSTADPLGYPL
jgi:hypothetical protein